MDGLSKRPNDLALFVTKSQSSDPTARCAIAKAFYLERIEMVEKAIIEADRELSGYLLKGVTEGLSFDILQARYSIPCSKDTYYDRYRRFFWLLDKARE